MYYCAPCNRIQKEKFKRRDGHTRNRCDSIGVSLSHIYLIQRKGLVEDREWRNWYRSRIDKPRREYLLPCGLHTIYDIAYALYCPICESGLFYTSNIPFLNTLDLKETKNFKPGHLWKCTAECFYRKHLVIHSRKQAFSPGILDFSRHLIDDNPRRYFLEDSLIDKEIRWSL